MIWCCAPYSRDKVVVHFQACVHSLFGIYSQMYGFSLAATLPEIITSIEDKATEATVTKKSPAVADENSQHQLASAHQLLSGSPFLFLLGASDGGGTRFFFWAGGGALRGQNAFQRGENPKIAENGWLLPFFLLTGGGRASKGVPPHAARLT